MRLLIALVALALCSADAGACDGRVAAWLQSHRPVRTFVANHRPGILVPLPAQSACAPAGYPTAAAGCPCGAACPCVPQAAGRPWNPAANCGSYACPADGGPAVPFAPAFGPAFAPAAPAYSSCPGGVCPAPARGVFRRW